MRGWGAGWAECGGVDGIDGWTDEQAQNQFAPSTSSKSGA